MSIVPISIALSGRVRPSPFERRVLEHGVKAFTIYNHMTLPAVFASLEEDCAHLCEHVQLWDVAVERQVEIVGPDAMALVELITPRDMSRCEIGQGMYAPLVDEFGGIINDPIILRLAADRFWLSIADSDVLLWLKGIVWGRGYNVHVFEPDVNPLAVQGPKADALMSDIVGEHARDIRFFRFIPEHIAGTDVFVARSGWSGQGGFEIYLQDSSFATALWDTIWEAGQKYNIRAGCPNLIERIESGLMSHGNEMTLADNPFECGLDRFFKLGKAAEYMSRAALDKIAAQGVSKKLVCVSIEGEPMTPIRDKCAVFDKANKKVGVMTSCAYSPRLQVNIAFAMLDIAHCEVGTQLKVSDDQGQMRQARVCNKDWH